MLLRRRTNALGRALAALICTNIAAGGLLAGTAPASAATLDVPPYFSANPTSDPDGFLRSWLVLEPVVWPNRTNQGFTAGYVRTTFAGVTPPAIATAVPRDGQATVIRDATLRWHSIHAGLFDVKLFNFAQNLGKPVYGVIFWVTTVVDADREIPDAHLAIGSNSASMWWLNNVEAASLFGDRRMVMDDVVSARVVLHKGHNVLRGAIINGPGLSDFCARFVDDAGAPIKNLTVVEQ